MTRPPRPGLTVLELCVALLLVGVLSSLAAVQFVQGPRPVKAPRPLSVTLRAARTTALRSGSPVSGAEWHNGEWSEYTVLPNGTLLIDSVATDRATGQRETRADNVEYR